MMRQMRENTKWIMLATAVAFVALMVFQWGMDITGRSSGGAGEIGRVNGTPVTYEQYQASYRNLYEQLSSSQETPVSAAQNKQVEDAAWNDVVNQILIQQELARRGIEVTNQEILDAARFSPPPELTGDPLFQTNGQFDIQKYQEFLANSADETFLLQLEAYYRDIIPRTKLLRQVTAGIYFSDAELWDQYRLQNEKVRVQFVALNPAERIPDASVTVTDAELDRYYQDHQEDFETPAQAEVKYVALTKAPLKEDTVAARQHAEDLRQEILNGADFAEVAKRESADQGSAAQGGDLGTFTRAQMVPAFDSVAFSIPVDRISEPVQTSNGFHIIQVLSRQGDSVHARHILVPIERTDDSELRLLTLADSLEALGESMTLDEAAANLGLPVHQQVMTEVFPFLPGAGQISDGLDWAFHEGTPGEVSPVFEDQQAFYMMELVSSSPAGMQSIEAARPTIDRILRMRKKVDLAQSQASELVQEADSAGSLEVLDGHDDLAVQEAGPSTRMDFFPGLGYQNDAVGTAFGLEMNEISDPVVSDNNVFLIQSLERTPADSTAWEEQKEAQRQQLTYTVQQQRMQQWIEGLRDAADIVDRRDQVLQSSQAQS